MYLPPTYVMNHNIENIFASNNDWSDFPYWMDKSESDHNTFNLFWNITKKEKKKNCWRAFWIVEKSLAKKPKWLNEILIELYQLMLKTNNNSYERIGLKLICQRPIINDDLASELLNKCEDLALNGKTPIATRTNCLQYIFEFCKMAPVLVNELNIILDHLSEQDNTAGMKSKIRNIRKEISKLK